MGKLIIPRLLALILFGFIAACGLFWLVFAVILPLLSDNAATLVLAVLLGLWIWTFRKVIQNIKNVKLW